MKNASSIIGIIVAFFFLHIANHAGAQSIFQNPITHGTPYIYNPYVLNQVVDPNISVSGLGRGSGINGNAATQRYNANNWSPSFTANEYFTFTLTPNSGYAINFTSLVYIGQRSGTGPTTFAVRSSLDGFASNIASPGVSGNINLSTSAFQGITTAIEFRIYGWGGNNSGGTYSINDFTFNGTVVLSSGPPILAAPSVTNLLDTTAKYNSSVIASPGSSIAEKGFVWSTSVNPVVGGGGVTKVTASGNTLGAYDATLNNLPRGTRIYFKAYAVNASGTGYSSELSFYTLSAEPVHASSFTATTTSKNSIRLDWSQVNSANGYLIIQRIYNPPTGVPADANNYTVNQALGDGTVIALIAAGATTTTTINGLLQGTRYHYTLFPFGYNGANKETYNYQTSATISAATDSTWGKPTSLASTVESGAGEAAFISSIKNEGIATINDGTAVWTMRLTDGGPTMDDEDDLPTIINFLRLRKGPSNTVANWSTAIESVALFDDSTGILLATGTVTSTAITFSGFTATAADDNYRPLRVRISLEKRTHTDNSVFQFLVAESDITTEGFITSSQKTTFSQTSDATMNKIAVVATKLQFINQPDAMLEAGVFMSTAIQVEALDTFNARDVDFIAAVSLDATSPNLIASPRSIDAINGVATFDTLRFNMAAQSDTLVASSTGLYDAKSASFSIFHSSKSDIVSDVSFAYPTAIVHLDYNDPASIHSGNAVEVFGLFLRDGGSTGDKDFVGTRLDSLVLNVQSGYLIHRAALYQGATKLSETDSVYVDGTNSQLRFGTINLLAQDEDSAAFSLYVTFKDSAVDGHRLVFDVNAAFAGSDLSIFAAPNAGGAISDASGANNTINVVAKKLIFTKQPTDVSRGTVMKPAVEVLAVDDKGNIDLLSRQVNMFVTRSGFTPSTIKVVGSGSDGRTVFSKLLFHIVSQDVYLRALSTGLDSAVSDSFEVRIPHWYRSVKSGNWSDTLTWEYSANYGQSWQAASDAPNYDQHGLITIRGNDTVQMDGITVEENTIDETIIEPGGVLITPMGAGNKLTLNDADSLDMVVRGKLVHKNGLSLGGAVIAAGAGIVVEKNAAIELAAFGDALDWAGNNAIHFDSGSYYVHSTGTMGSISNGVMFPNASASVIPTFLVNASVAYPGNLVAQNSVLTINGLLEISSGNTFTVKGSGYLNLRDGLKGDGTIRSEEFIGVRFVGARSVIDGAGEVSIHGNSYFAIANNSKTVLLHNKPMNSSGNGFFNVEGTFDASVYEFNGTAKISSAYDAVVITAHAQGLDGTFQTTGNRNLDAGTNYIFNGNLPQETGFINSLAAKTVKLNNSYGLTLSNALRVTDTLYMGSGHIYTDSAAILSIPMGAVISNYGTASYVDGPMRIMTNGTPVFFPVGNMGHYGPVTFKPVSAGAEWVTLQYIALNPDLDGYPVSSRGAGLAQINTGEYWKLTASQGNVEVPYTSLSSIMASQTENRRVVSWDGSRWNSEGPVSRSATGSAIESDRMHWVSVFTLAVDSVCATPAAPSFSPLAICNGAQVNLQASGNGEIRWFVNATDTAPFAKGAMVSMGAISADTIFYTDMKVLGCISQRVAYPVTINPLPSSPVITGNRTVCYNSPATLTGASSGTMVWYSGAQGSVPAFTGTTFVSSRLIKDTTLYARHWVNGCASPVTLVHVGVNDPVSAPAIQNTQVCQGFNAEIRLMSSNSIRWYLDSSTSNLLHQGSRYQVAHLQSDTAFFAEAVDGRNCPSDRVRVAVQALPLPPAPPATNAELCEGNSLQLSTTSLAQEVFWYDDPSSGLALDSGQTFITPVLFADKSYFTASFNGTCYSYRSEFAVQVNPYPQSFGIQTPVDIPRGQAVSLSTDAVADTYNWNFGPDATPQTATGAGPHNVSWTTNGVRTVSLTVWNGTAGACSTKVEKIVAVSPGTGLADRAGVNVSFYPNPLVQSREITIELASTTIRAEVKVYDASGKLAVTAILKGSGAVDMGNVKPGLYLVTIVGDGFVVSEKLIVE